MPTQVAKTAGFRFTDLPLMERTLISMLHRHQGILMNFPNLPADEKESHAFKVSECARMLREIWFAA